MNKIQYKLVIETGIGNKISGGGGLGQAKTTKNPIKTLKNLENSRA